MRYKRLGNTGLKVSEICLGTMTFGGQGFWTAIGTLDQGAVDRIVGTALDGGVNFIDTANIYSDGLSEELTGRAIAARLAKVISALRQRARALCRSARPARL